MTFAALDASLTQSCFDGFGEPAVFEDGEGVTLNTRAQLDEETTLMGELGPVRDARPSLILIRADVGRPRRGAVTLLGRRFALDQLLSDDGQVVRYAAREEPVGG